MKANIILIKRIHDTFDSTLNMHFIYNMKNNVHKLKHVKQLLK